MSSGEAVRTLGGDGRLYMPPRKERDLAQTDLTEATSASSAAFASANNITVFGS